MEGARRKPRWWVLHVDMDQFVVAIELARHPELGGRPVLVGGAGDPARRGVVSGASYEARAYGVRSGTPLRTAAARCPEAVFLPVDAPHYEAVSRRIMAVLRRFPVVVEVLGWDEAFLGAYLEDPQRLAVEVQSAVRQETGLSCSVGIGENRLQAKTASVLAKPGGTRRLTTITWDAVMGERSVEDLWGIGPRTARRLRDLGVLTVTRLGTADPAILSSTFGPRHGLALRALARGRSEATVSAAQRRPTSHGRQLTYEHDLTDTGQMHREVRRLARLLADELQSENAKRLVVTVRYHPFETHSHGVPLDPETSDPTALELAAETALGTFALDRPVRLLGVRAELTSADRPPRRDLGGHATERR